MGVKRYAQDECGANGPTRRMAIILNCQLSIVNSANGFNSYNSLTPEI